MKKTIVILLLAFFISSPLDADDNRFYFYNITFGSNDPAAMEDYSLKACQKGDILNISISDALNLNREEMYLAGEIAELCDGSKPITIIGKNRAVCTYNGKRRQPRGYSEKKSQ